MAAAKEVLIGDDELDALMAELDAETADMVVKPAIVAAVVVPDPEPEPTPEPEPVVKPTLADEPDEAAEQLKAAAAEADKKEALAAKLKQIEADHKATVAAAATEAEPNPAPKKGPPALNFYIDMDEFKAEIRVSDTNLDDCLMQQSGIQAFHGSQAANAVAQADRIKLQVEIAEAKLYNDARKSLALAGEKVTEKMVENAVRLDPRYASMHNRLIEADTIASVRRHCYDAIKTRRDMIIQLGADRRDEFKGQARITALEEGRKEVFGRAAALVGK